MNLLSQNYDYLSQSDSNQCRLMADFAALMPRRWQLRLGQQAVSVYVVGKVSQTNLREYPQSDTLEDKVFSAYPASDSDYHFPLTTMMIFPGDDIGLSSPTDLQEIAHRTITPNGLP